MHMRAPKRRWPVWATLASLSSLAMSKDTGCAARARDRCLQSQVQPRGLAGVAVVFAGMGRVACSFLTPGLLVAVFAAASVQSPATALACRCTLNQPDFIVDLWRDDGDERVVLLPRDGRGVLWWNSGAAKLDKTFCAVQRLSGTSETVVDFSVQEVRSGLYLVAPLDKLAPGEIYRFRCHRPPPKWMSATPRTDWERQRHKRYQSRLQSRPRPPKEVTAIVENTTFASVRSQLRIVASKPKQVKVLVAAAGGCQRSLSAVSLEVYAKGHALDRWLSVLLFDTVIDGKQDWKPIKIICSDVVPGSSWFGRGQDRLYTACGETGKDGGLDPGSHRVRMVVSLPGTKLQKRTRSLSLKLRCK